MSTDVLTSVSAQAQTLDERLDRLSAQVEEIAADLKSQRESREKWEELAGTLVPVSRGAFDLASRELEDLGAEVTAEDAVRLARTLARSLPQLERLLAEVQGLTDLGSEVTSLSGAGFAKAADVLADAERKGYFAVARGGRTVLDRVVAGCADEDFDVLGDHVVQFLTVAKGLSSPELTGLMDRTLVMVRRGQSTREDPPSTLSLLKSLREPAARRGLARALDVLRVLGAEAPAAPHETVTHN